MTSAKALLAAVLVALSAPLAAGQIPRIAIIIDDLGYELLAGERTIALPGPVACAILPGTPRARYLANVANAQGKEVLLHLPMQAVGPETSVEATRMTLDMSRSSFAATFAAAFDSVPHAIGINNHRGSLLTRHPGHMQWLMEELLEHDGLFFVDSFTTAESVALQIASELGVQATRRDVFLDPDKTSLTLRREFERLKTVARKRGSAVAIGHPYESTLALLERELPRLAEQGFDLVPVSELVAN
ncbi:MAG: divergent polysaccharide deacetylase family protein [Proteobacteria bacterium]|nr:divergent polysaccharide deacetylase family protein [Pseudomonadota bacterium]MCH7981880.1 divergent polysaccharide deacetylase family protein [Pseudomonadota bacterium]